MSEHERIYPRKPRKPQKSERSKELKKQVRAHKRIGKQRVKEAIKKWPEYKELEKIRANPDQPAMTDYLPDDDEKPSQDEDKPDV